MNITKSCGESSCKGQEDGDGSTGSERPLKKARFAWQVKGKHHLKNEITQSNKSSPLESNTLTFSEPKTERIPIKTESSCDDLGNFGHYLSTQDYTTMNSTIVNHENSILTPNNNVALQKYQCPRYISKYDRMMSTMENNNTREISQSVSFVDHNSEDQCISQWQAKQMVTCCIDNTINRVLDRWLQVPLPAPAGSANSRSLALNMAQFVNHLPGDNTVENEGILMAISAHGLQNTPSSSSNNDSDNSSSGTASPLQSLSPVPPDDDVLSNVEPAIEEHRNNDDFFDDVFDSVGDTDNHCQFMNAAVLFAIKSKGLTASGTDYG